MNRLIATNSLKYFGCSVSEAADGQKAISLLNQRNDFDFILMDIQMPIMDGLECTKHIREILKNDVPIIALTANAFKSDIDLYLSIGMNAYVTKPFEEYILFDTIANTLIKLQPLVDKNSKSASSKEPTQLYDLSKIKDLSRGDNNFINKMINIFIEHTPVGLSEMKIAIDNNDAMTASKIAHKMKPSIDNMSISMLKSPIREIEAEGKSPSPNFEKIIMLYNNLEETLNIIVNQLKDKVKG
jgi:CheY-like chemotaxis protein